VRASETDASYGLPIMSVDLAERVQMRRAWKTLAAVGFTNLQMAMALSMVFAELANSFHDIRVNLRAPAAVRGEREGTPAYSATS